jgi:hypothetical protein
VFNIDFQAKNKFKRGMWKMKGEQTVIEIIPPMEYKEP